MFCACGRRFGNRATGSQAAWGSPAWPGTGYYGLVCMGRDQFDQAEVSFTKVRQACAAGSPGCC